jgi:SpoVK/Ycf46/Vps4 family AAA+-type ATPase
VLLQELEVFNGVVIFATNMAANFDPAFERRLRTHVLFEMPGVNEREQIWRVQVHPDRTPLAEDVNFRALAEAYAVSGGDIRNAVLKAAMAAASEPGSDAQKSIHQRHFEEGIGDVLTSKRVMSQSLPPSSHASRADDPADLLQRLDASLQKSTTLPSLLAIAALLIAVAALVAALVR